MHPLSTALFLVGYGLALPIGARLSSVVAGRKRLPLAAHQIGVMIATLGWALRRSVVLIVVHVIWLVAVKIWFDVAGRRQAVDATGGSPTAT